MSRVIDAVLRLRDEFTKPLQNSINMMTAADKAGAKTRKAVEKFGNSMANVGAGLTAAITVPVAAAGAGALKTAADFEKSMSQVQATMGLTKESTTELNGATVNTMDALEQLARDLGKSTKYSASEAAEAINNMAMAGYNVQEAYDTLPTVLSLASAGNLDLDYATQLVANGMAVMGDRCASAQEMADMMAVTASNAYGSVADFGEGLLVAGGQASICGQSLADTYTALGILGDAGMQGSEGGTALRNALKNLYQPTDKAAAVLDSLGITTSDAEGNLLSMQNVLQQLQTAMSGMTEAEKSTAMGEIFDTRTLAAANALMSNSTDRWNELSATISGASSMYDGQGAAAGMAATQLDNLEGRLTILKSGIEELAISLGETLLPYAEKAVAWIQQMTDKFNGLDQGTKDAIVKFALVAASVGPMLTVFGKAIALGANLFGAFTKIKAVMSGISAAGGIVKFALAALASPIGVVVAAVAGIGAVIAIVVTHIDMFKQAFAEVAPVVVPAVNGLLNTLQQFGATVSPIFSAIGNVIATVLAGAFQGLLLSASLAISGITTVLQGFMGIIQGVVTFVTALVHGDWSTAFEGLKQVALGVFQAIVGAIESVIGAISSVVTVVGGAIGKVGELIGKIGKAKGSSAGLPGNATGTTNWQGGWTRVNEKGGEIINLPSGTQIIPHDASRNTPVGGGITIAKLADSIIVREDADIDRIGDAIVRKLKAASANRGGWTYSGSMA